MKVGFCSLGCKVNAYETEYAINEFKKRGYEIVSFDDYADVYVVNTCSVTNASDQKSRKMLRSACNKNKNAVVVAMGCYAQVNSKVIEDIDGVSIIIGNKDKNKIVDLVEEYIKDNKKIENIYDLFHTSFEDMYLDKFENHTRAFVKIQDGCNAFCSYCIIPYVRGRVRSRKPEDIVNEVKTLAATGVKEVVLTGIHISSYGTDLENISLIELIEAIHEIEGIKRIRLGSLEPRIITEEFAKRIAGLEKICPHFHLSLQSGCDKTLKAMNRKYNTQEYYEGCVKLREVFDNPAITTDVIVGFPGETEEDFLETRNFLEKVHFYEMHIFKYSRRKGTVADKMKEQVADTVKSERSAVLLALEKAQSLEYRKMYIGKRLEVLIEELTEIDGRSYYTGYTKNYIRVAIAADEFKNNPVNDIYECMADKLICDGVTILARCN